MNEKPQRDTPLDSPPEVSADLIIDTIPDGLIVLDSSCKMRRWNKAMEKIAGYREQDVLGMPCSILDFRDAASGEPLDQERKCMASGHPNPEHMREIECTLQTSHGETVPIRKIGKVLMNTEGHSIGILMILVDLRPLRRLEEQIHGIEAFTRNEQPPGKFVGVSPQMQVVYNRIRLAARSDVTILIEGETGTGKELVVEAIHSMSNRHDKPLIKVNCSALSENLLESELFGHVKGAFTGAIKDKPGRIEMAEGGTLFLDEIGDVSPLIQLKLLRVLQEHEYERVGDSKVRRANVRFVAATHRNLKARVAQELFREDFYYRICVFSIMMPALREHKSDIPLLCDAFISRLNHKTGKNIRRLSSEAMKCMMNYCWPGNIRQLENAIEHAFVMCFGEAITRDELPEEICTNYADPACNDFSDRQAETPAKHTTKVLLPAYRPRRRITREMLVETLQKCNWNQSEAARRLGVDRTTIWRRIKQWALIPPYNSG
jgi:PAS domain S-box-containing protein